MCMIFVYHYIIFVQAGVCPPDSLELGSATWTFLHSVAAYYPDNPTDQHKQDALNLVNGLPR